MKLAAAVGVSFGASLGWILADQATRALFGLSLWIPDVGTAVLLFFFGAMTVYLVQT